jgi:hypothetical protein
VGRRERYCTLTWEGGKGTVHSVRGKEGEVLYSYVGRRGRYCTVTWEGGEDSNVRRWARAEVLWEDGGEGNVGRIGYDTVGEREVPYAG